MVLKSHGWAVEVTCDVKSVCLDIKELDWNGALSMWVICFVQALVFLSRYFWNPSAKDVWILDYMLPLVTVQLFWHSNGSHQNNLTDQTIWEHQEVVCWEILSCCLVWNSLCWIILMWLKIPKLCCSRRTKKRRWTSGCLININIILRLSVDKNIAASSGK